MAQNLEVLNLFKPLEQPNCHVAAIDVIAHAFVKAVAQMPDPLRYAGYCFAGCMVILINGAANEAAFTVFKSCATDKLVRLNMSLHVFDLN